MVDTDLTESPFQFGFLFSFIPGRTCHKSNPYQF